MINKPHQRSAWQSLAYIIPVSVLVVIVLCYWDYIPLWDSRAYFDGCILPAVANPFNLFAFNCSNHGTLSFGLLYGAAQYFDYGNILYAHLTSIALLCISFYFYYLILKHLFTNSLWVASGMALLCWNPAIVANALNPTPDLVVLATSIACLWSFLTQRLALTACIGVLLLFSKESGVIFYAFSCLGYMCLFESRYNKKSALKNLLILSIPFFIYAIFMWYKTHILTQNLLFQDSSVKDLLKRLFLVNGFDNNTFVTLSMMFVLNFQWITLGGILLGSIIISIPTIMRGDLHFYPRTLRQKQIAYISLITLLLCYTLSQYPHFLNVRYYLLVFPLTNLLFLGVIQKIYAPAAKIAVALFVIIIALSCFRTIDPISRNLFGTFHFGTHKLLSIPTIKPECCGYGRDQLVYNLEHTQLQLLLNKFYQKISLANTDVILTNPLADFFINSNLTRDTYQQTLRIRDAYHPIYFNDPIKLKRNLSNLTRPRIYYPDYPNIPDRIFHSTLSTLFTTKTIITVENHGYQLNILELNTQ